MMVAVAGETDTTVPLRGDSGRDSVPEVSTYGRFVARGLLGRGGMGVVLRARDPELDRDVAIKLLSPSTWNSEDLSNAERLQREAQAMAKLSHPNVVAVYEMGRVGDDRFIAMELVEGTTLRRWLADHERPWREILRAFIACGRGLAAAHDAGLVHRDFKPENVLIGLDGRPRVSDFGLVASGVAVENADVIDAPAGVSLTVRGAVLGTPGYMAPEQWLGLEVDARTDQFAFCVALWEGLYRDRPFSGAVSDVVRENVLSGAVRSPPRDRRIGRWISSILRRGLSRNPAARWPSMKELLAALEPPQRRWPWVVGVMIPLAAAAAIVPVALTRTRGADPCPDPAERLTAVWDPAVKAKLVAGFTAASPAIAAETSQRVATALDGYSQAWRSAHVAACRATREGNQSQDLLDRRMLCLDRRLNELGSVTRWLAGNDRDRVARAVDTVGALGDLEQCANKEMMLAQVLPTDPAQRRRVEELERKIAAAYDSRFTDKPAERQASARAILASARVLGYVPTIVRALDEVSSAAQDNADNQTAETALRELAQSAAEAHDDQLAARAWIDLIRVITELHRLDEATTLEPVAEAAVRRAGAPARLRYVLLATQGIRRMYSQDFAAAVDKLRASVDAASTGQQRASAQLALSQVLFMKDGPTSAIPVAEQSLAATEEAYGPNHPRTADALHLIAQFLIATDEPTRLPRAFELETRVLAIREAAFGADHRDVAIAVHQLADIAKNRGDGATARRLYERAIKIFDADHAPSDAGLSRGMLASVVADDDGLAAARPVFVAALEGLGTVGKDNLEYIAVEVTFAERLIDDAGCREAAPLLAHAHAILSEISPRELPRVLEPEARCEQVMNRQEKAIEKLEQARTLCAEHGCPPPIRERLAWRLGKVLVESRRDRMRGLLLVDEAAASAKTSEGTDLLREIEVWRNNQ